MRIASSKRDDIRQTLGTIGGALGDLRFEKEYEKKFAADGGCYWKVNLHPEDGFCIVWNNPDRPTAMEQRTVVFSRNTNPSKGEISECPLAELSAIHKNLGVLVDGLSAIYPQLQKTWDPLLEIRREELENNKKMRALSGKMFAIGGMIFITYFVGLIGMMLLRVPMSEQWICTIHWVGAGLSSLFLAPGLMLSIMSQDEY